MKFVSVFSAVILTSVAGQAAADPLRLYPVQTGAETVRFRKGIPTLNLETATGGVQITPLPFDHGHVTVGIGVYNKSAQALNFGIENISSTIAGRPAVVLSSFELQKRAKSRAMWSQIGMAVLAGAAAAAASQAYTTSNYNGYLLTPHGTYSWASSYRDNSLGVLGATAAIAGGAASIVGIQNRLDYTLDNLANEIVQTTTIDPDASYGGRIVVEKDEKAKIPYDVRIVMSLNGADYPFVFRVTKEGVNLPPPYTAAPAAAAATLVPAAVSPSQAGVGSPSGPSSASQPMPVPSATMLPTNGAR